MSLKLPESVPIPKAGLLEALGTGLGQGFQGGVQQAIPLMVKLAMNQRSKLEKQKTPLTPQEGKSFLQFGNVSKLFPDPDDQYKILSKINKRIGEVGRQQAMEEFGKSPTTYLQEDIITPEVGIGVEEEKKPLSQFKGGLGQRLTDVLGLTEGAAEERGIGEVIKKHPTEIVGIPTRGWLDFLSESISGKPLIPRALRAPTLTEYWREEIEKDLSPKAREALRQGEVASIILTDVLAGLFKKSPKIAQELANDVIKAKKYPDSVLREVRDLTKEYKPTKEIKIPSKELSKEAIESRRLARKSEAKELAKRPLETYLKERVTSDTPAIKSEKLKANKELIKINSDIDRIQSNITKLDNQIEKGIKNKRSLELVERTKSNYENQLEKLKEQKKTQEYISRKGVEPFSEEKTIEEATKHNKEIKKAFDNPESIDSQKIVSQFNRDQKYVEEAMNILKRRKDVPVEPYKDFYIKKHETYNNSYRKMISKLEEQINMSKGTEKKYLEGLRDKFKTNFNINESKLIKHREKLETKKAVKEGGSFLKKYLADLRNDIPKFKSDIIQYKKALERGIGEKISKQSEKILKDLYQKSFEEVLKNSSNKNIKQISEKIQKAQNEAGYKEIPKSKFDKLNPKLKKNYEKSKNMIRGLTIGAIKEYIKAKTGLNIPTRGLYKFVGIGTASAITYVTFLRNVYKNLKKHNIVRNFKKIINAKNPTMLKKYRTDLIKKGYTDRQVDNLQKLATN